MSEKNASVTVPLTWCQWQWLPVEKKMCIDRGVDSMRLLMRLSAGAWLGIAAVAVLLYLALRDCLPAGLLSEAAILARGSAHVAVTATAGASDPAAFPPPRVELPAAAAVRTILTSEFRACMIDVGQNLPISPSGQLAAHHYDAGTGKWNEAQRFDSFDMYGLPPSPLILDIGGNTKAADSTRFRMIFPSSTIHIYEPVPAYSLQLEWRGVVGVHVHKYGLGGSSRDVAFVDEALRGQSTFIMDAEKPAAGAGAAADADANAAAGVGEALPLAPGYMRIVDGAAEMATLAPLPSSHIDILHMNCEGCEWELLSRLAAVEGSFERIHILQVSFHNYGKDGIGALLPQYCTIREALRRTHAPVSLVPFGWERWVRKAA
jgi:hypothetical protein